MTDTEKLRQLAYAQHRAIGALRRLHGGNQAFDDTGAEELWWYGESDEGWALICDPDDEAGAS